MLFAQHLDRAVHELLFVPMNAFEARGNATAGIKDLSLDAMPIHQRRDEVNSELEVSTKRIVMVGDP